MDIKIDYAYSQSFYPTARHRKLRVRKLTDTTTVHIPELSEQEFPVAFLVQTMKSVCEDMASYEDYDSQKTDFRLFEEEIRTYKGKLYQPVRIQHGAAISTRFEDSKAIKHCIERYGAAQFSCHNTAEALSSGKSIVVLENKTAHLKEIRSKAADFLYFDEKFWEVCGEPRYVLHTFGLGRNHGSTSLSVTQHYNENISAKNYFNALQREDAIAYGKAIAANRGDTNSIEFIGEYDNIVVLLPEMVQICPTKQHGNGNEFLNTAETMIQTADSPLEAALLLMTQI